MINVLVSTTKLQGRRDNDFCFVPEGEMVKFGFECHSDRGNVDGNCGCLRALVGIYSSTATTTFTVGEFDGTEEDFHKLMDESYQREGWGSSRLDNSMLLKIAAECPVGVVLEKRGDVIQSRQTVNEIAAMILETMEKNKLLQAMAGIGGEGNA